MKSLIGALASSSLSFWRGTQIGDLGVRPTQRMYLYDQENDAECRLVREALTELDLDVVVYPCPIGGTRFRNQLLAVGGRDRVPFLVDPNTSTALYGSEQIIRHLFQRYSARAEVPRRWQARGLLKLSSKLAAASRLGAGVHAKPSHRPDLLLELYSFESSPYARSVRELLCELEIPYVLHNIGKDQIADYLLPAIRERFWKGYVPKSRNRSILFKDTGRVMSPHLVDSNTGRRLYESRDILRYLRAQYSI